ncbi:MAG: molybdopterin-dependent oxidoreductase [Myxococcota bacterium]|nr:molybdopterin-dependent oxidoreductase [Myxococcota bacterium]
MTQRATAETIHRTCPLCEAHCGITVHVDRDANRVAALKGDPADAVSGGYVCPKVVGLRGLEEDPDRLVKPLLRRDGEFVEIEWEEALELAASKLSEIRDTHGANAIATYLGNPNAHDYAAGLTLPLFQRALGTRWRFSATSVDQLPKMVSSCVVFGAPFAVPVPDIDHTDFFLVLGANPLASNGSLMTAPDMRGRLRRLRERGGRLVVVDPRRSETAEVADQHLFIRPGADALFLFAFVHVLFEEGLVDVGALADSVRGLDELEALAKPFSPEAVAAATGVEPGTLRELVRSFAAAERGACYGRIGTCTQEFGALSSWLVDVVNTLTGNLDAEGGVRFPRPAHGPGRDEPRRKGRVPYARWRSRVRGLPEFAGELPVAALAEEIDTPGDERIRALVTVAGNPVLSTPNGERLDRALESLDFVVCVDIYLNETTRHADLILPTTPPLQRANYDLAFHGFSVRDHAKWSPAVFDPPPEARHLWQVLLEIAGRINGTTAEAAAALALRNVIESSVGPGSTCPGIDADAAAERVAGLPYPEAVLDVMLRAGPYGDHFDDDDPGLSLGKLQAATHGVDLGPLKPRLPEMLATESGAVELAPSLLVEDVPRLLAALERDASGMVLIGRRHLRSNNSWMHNLPALAKGPERCTLMVHPGDAERLGLSESGQAKVRSRVGSVVAPVEITDALMPGVVSLPHGHGHSLEGARLSVAAQRPGVNSNLLTDELGIDALSGNAILNGIPVEISPA